MTRDRRTAVHVGLEQNHVYNVYDQIAPHFGEIRHRAWPNVRKFLRDLEPGSLVADVGCGSGRYLQINNEIYKVGLDRCCPLVNAARTKGHEVMVADNLKLPYRDGVFDAVISIGVIHHFASPRRRIQAVRELARIIRPGGKLMIYVWAYEQKHRRFDGQDLLIPWQNAQEEENLVTRHSSSADREVSSASSVSEDDLTSVQAEAGYQHSTDLELELPPYRQHEQTSHHQQNGFANRSSSNIARNQQILISDENNTGLTSQGNADQGLHADKEKLVIECRRLETSLKKLATNCRQTPDAGSGSKSQTPISFIGNAQITCPNNVPETNEVCDVSKSNLYVSLSGNVEISCLRASLEYSGASVNGVASCQIETREAESDNFLPSLSSKSEVHAENEKPDWVAHEPLSGNPRYQQRTSSCSNEERDACSGPPPRRLSSCPEWRTANVSGDHFDTSRSVSISKKSAINDNLRIQNAKKNIKAKQISQTNHTLNRVLTFVNGKDTSGNDCSSELGKVKETQGKSHRYIYKEQGLHDNEPLKIESKSNPSSHKPAEAQSLLDIIKTNFLNIFEPRPHGPAKKPAKHKVSESTMAWVLSQSQYWDNSYYLPSPEKEANLLPVWEFLSKDVENFAVREFPLSSCPFYRENWSTENGNDTSSQDNRPKKGFATSVINRDEISGMSCRDVQIEKPFKISLGTTSGILESEIAMEENELSSSNSEVNENKETMSDVSPESAVFIDEMFPTNPSGKAFTSLEDIPCIQTNPKEISIPSKDVTGFGLNTANFSMFSTSTRTRQEDIALKKQETEIKSILENKNIHFTPRVRFNSLREKPERAILNEEGMKTKSKSLDTLSSKNADTLSQQASSKELCRYYHVFKEGEMVDLINDHVENLHIISTCYDHSNWCIVAERVQVWKI